MLAVCCVVAGVYRLHKRFLSNSKSVDITGDMVDKDLPRLQQVKHTQTSFPPEEVLKAVIVNSKFGTPSAQNKTDHFILIAGRALNRM